MATGITKINWEEDARIINSEQFLYDINYEIVYEGKLSEKEIIETPFSFEYKHISGSSNNNLYYGDNLDVLRYLLYSPCNLKNKVKLIYIYRSSLWN